MRHCVITPDFERKECAPPICVSKSERKKMAQVSVVKSDLGPSVEPSSNVGLCGG